MAKEFDSIQLKVVIPLGILAVLAAGILLTSSGSGSWAGGSVYVNTIDYTIYSFFHDVLGLSWVPLRGIVIAGYILLGLLLSSLMYYAYLTVMSPKTLLKVILLSIFSFIMLWSYHSPQYFFWYIPIVAVLIADDWWGVLLFYVVQVLAFIEFPQLPGYLYTNTQYLFTISENPSSWYLTWGFFVVFQSLLVYLVYRAIGPNFKEILKTIGG